MRVAVGVDMLFPEDTHLERRVSSVGMKSLILCVSKAVWCHRMAGSRPIISCFVTKRETKTDGTRVYTKRCSVSDSMCFLLLLLCDL